MPRKATTTAHVAASLVAAPESVSTMKRARRAKLAHAETIPAPAPPPRLEVDLSQPTARKILAAAFPAPANETMLEATEAQELAAATYIAARERATVETARKEAAGTVLIDGIREDLGVTGNGWKATWNTKKGDIDWGKLCKALNIDSDTIEAYRKPSYRVIDVRETAEET